MSVYFLMYNSANTTTIYTFYQNVGIQSHAFILHPFTCLHTSQNEKKKDTLGHIKINSKNINFQFSFL